MADEEKVENQEQTNETKKKGETLGDKARKSNKKFFESETASKGIAGRELNAEEKGKIKNLAVEFWNDYGKDHQDDIGSWANHDKGAKLIKHFASDGKCADLYANCSEYKSCFDAYQKEKGDTNYNYDESSVDFNRLQTDYDVAFFIVLSGLPRFLISATNQHTMGFVMTRFNEGESISSIVKIARTKLGTQAKTSDGKEKEDASEKANGESEEVKEDKPSEEEKVEDKEANVEKQESIKYAVVTAKNEFYDNVKKGYFGDDAKDLLARVERELNENGIDNKNEIYSEILKAFNDRMKQNINENQIDPETINKYHNNIAKKDMYNDLLNNEVNAERTSE